MHGTSILPSVLRHPYPQRFLPITNFGILKRAQLACSSARYCHQTSASSDIIVNKSEFGVENITLNSPKTRNALSLQLMQALTQELVRAGKDKTTRSIVLRGEGKVFSAGHNLKEMTLETGPDYHKQIFDTCERLMRLVGTLPVPVISSIDGLAAAAGCQLVASCDIAVCTPESRFSTPGAAVGLFCHTPGIPLARKVPRSMSGYMLLTGLPISGEEAYRSGLVSKMVPRDQLKTEIDSICAAIAAKPRGVISLGKSFYKKQVDLTLDEAYPRGGQVMGENLLYKDAQEGIQAFKEKRKPVFTHGEDKAI